MLTSKYHYIALQLWDVATDQEVVDLLQQNNTKSAKQLAKLLLKYALKKGSTDNISIFVIRL